MVDRAQRAAADGPRCIIAAAGARADPVSLPVVRPGARRSRARGPSGLALAALAGAAHADGLALTYQRCDGNRTIAGAGPGRGARAIDVSLPANAAWVVAAPVEDGARWLVALEDGRVARVRVDAAGGVGPARLGADHPAGDRLPAGAPPAAKLAGGDLALLAPGQRASRLTHPVQGVDGLRVEIGADGRLRVGTRTVASAKALPDARIAIDGSRAVVLGDPTDRYRHGVLGDGHEARSALVLDLAAASVLARIEPPRGWVLEGIAPILADLDGDGVREIVLTESAEGEGARLAAYRRDASLAGASAPIGRGYRWRHQIAVGATRPGGPPELVSVRTPHLGGIAEYFRLDAGRLVQVAAYRGVSSHAIGSRNLDAAALADWDGDGGLELLVPNLAHDALVVVSRTRDGAEEQTRLAAGGRIATNLAGAIAGGVLHVGFGTGDGRLRLWGLLHSRTE